MLSRDIPFTLRRHCLGVSHLISQTIDRLHCSAGRVRLQRLRLPISRWTKGSRCSWPLPLAAPPGRPWSRRNGSNPGARRRNRSATGGDRLESGPSTADQVTTAARTGLRCEPSAGPRATRGFRGDDLRSGCAPGGIRTHTETLLRSLPLPIGLRGRAGQPSCASTFARSSTSSIIGGVSRPVKVFCWLTW